MSMNESPPPGWFPDPDHAGWQRWWDGQQWADYWIEGAQPPPEGFPDPTSGFHGVTEQAAGQAYAPSAGQTEYTATEQPAMQQPAVEPAAIQQPAMEQPVSEQYVAPYDPNAAVYQGFGTQGVPAQGMPDYGMVPAPPPAAPNTGGGKSRGLIIGLVAAGLVLVLIAGLGILAMTRGGGNEAKDEPTTSTTANGEAEPGKGPNILAACEVQEPASIPGTEISVDPVTVSEEEAVGDDVRADVLSQIDESSDTGAKDNLNNILGKVKPADTPYGFNVTVLESEDVNAFVIPGGDIFFTTAIIEMMNDDELAFIMAHEISHELCHHLATRMQQQELIMAGAEAVTGTIDADPETVAGIATALFAVGNLIGGYTRADETEADLAGLELIIRTDYPPEAGVTALEKLASIETDETADTLPEFLSTHPLTQKRIDQLQAEIDALDD